MRLHTLRQRLVQITVSALSVGGLALSASAAVHRAEPLEVPLGPPPGAEEWAHLGTLERLETTAESWRDHGYREMPHLAWAVLELAERERRPELVRRAREWAPSSPGVQLEVARMTWSMPDLVRSLSFVSGNFPSVVWIGTVGLAAVGLGLILATTVVVVFCFARGLPLIGHALVHFWSQRPSASWLGSLLILCGISLLPLFGVGPLLMVGVVGAVALTGVPRVYGMVVVILLSASGLALGPGLDRWAALATVPGPHSALLPAWRIERGQPLPGDRALLAHRMSLGEATPVERLALATSLKREGDFERVEALLAEPPAFDRRLGAHASTLLGTAHLAWGEVREAVETFEAARRAEVSAPTLFNMAQAKGRALELKEQTVLFTQARSLDPDLIRRAADYLGTNVHRFLLELPVPLDAYMADAVQVGPDSQLLAADVRSWMLGRRAPRSAWLLLPALAIVGMFFRVRGAVRCVKCVREICRRCSPAPGPGPTCLRCKRLAVPDPSVDPRVRRQEHDRELRRRKAIQIRWMLIGLGIPGGSQLLRGRVVTGGIVLLSLLIGGSLLLTSERLPPPVDMGRLATLVPLACAAVLMVPALVIGVMGAFGVQVGDRQ